MEDTKDVDGVNPKVDKPQFPAEYGNPKQRLDWDEVEKRIESATVYWFASTRPDGRPHVVPAMELGSMAASITAAAPRRSTQRTS